MTDYASSYLELARTSLRGTEKDLKALYTRQKNYFKDNQRELRRRNPAAFDLMRKALETSRKNLNSFSKVIESNPSATMEDLAAAVQILIKLHARLLWPGQPVVEADARMELLGGKSGDSMTRDVFRLYQESPENSRAAFVDLIVPLGILNVRLLEGYFTVGYYNVTEALARVLWNHEPLTVWVQGDPEPHEYRPDWEYGPSNPYMHLGPRNISIFRFPPMERLDGVLWGAELVAITAEAALSLCRLVEFPTEWIPQAYPKMPFWVGFGEINGEPRIYWFDPFMSFRMDPDEPAVAYEPLVNGIPIPLPAPALIPDVFAEMRQSNEFIADQITKRMIVNLMYLMNDRMGNNVSRLGTGPAPQPRTQIDQPGPTIQLQASTPKYIGLYEEKVQEIREGHGMPYLRYRIRIDANRRRKPRIKKENPLYDAGYVCADTLNLEEAYDDYLKHLAACMSEALDENVTEQKAERLLCSWLWYDKEEPWLRGNGSPRAFNENLLWRCQGDDHMTNVEEHIKGPEEAPLIQPRARQLRTKRRKGR